MSRRAARERAFQLIFQYIILQRQAEPAEVGQNLNDLEEMLELPPSSAEERAYILAVVPAVVNHSQTLDQTYEPYLKDWKLERLPKVDLAIFRLAVYEILQRPEVPFSVTLNEAVLLAKRYGSVSSSRYINGVLARISKPETNITPAAEPEEQAACGYHQTAAAAAGAADSQPADAAAAEKKLTGAVPEAVRPAEQEALGGG